jgi:soluble lytic murein transglycosylase-like protein
MNGIWQKTAFDATIKKAAEKYGLELWFLRALIWQESRFHPEVVSKRGAIGLCQLLPDTAAELKINPYDPWQNIEGGAKYLAKLLKRYKGDKPLALAGYNAGMGNVRKYKGIPPFKETKNYIKEIMAWENSQPPEAEGEVIA